MSYIKLMRSVKDKAFYSKDSEKVHLWIHLLLSANWSDNEEMLGGKPIICKAGQFTTGRKQLSIATGINESKIERLLTYFEKTEQQIEQRKTSVNRLISILNWDKYQCSEQRIEQQVNNDRTTSEQRVNTLEENKEHNNLNNIDNIVDKPQTHPKPKSFIIPNIQDIIDYCLERNNKVDAKRFFNFYESKGWMVGKNKMKDWKACVRTWEQENKKNNNTEIKPMIIYNNNKDFSNDDRW